MRVLQGRAEFGLSKETDSFFGLGSWWIGRIGDEDFQCHNTIQTKLFGFVDDAHTTATDFAEDLVFTEDRFGFEDWVNGGSVWIRGVLVQGCDHWKEISKLLG